MSRVEHYSVPEANKRVFTIIADMASMRKLDLAQKILPHDTQYVLVAELVERDVDESFDATDVATIGPIPVGIHSGSQYGGIGRRFVGYVSIGNGKLRIHTKDSLLLEDDVPNISVYYEQDVGGYVMKNATTKFALQQLAIVQSGGSFESTITPMTNGIDPLFQLLEKQGAAVHRWNGQIANKRLATTLIFGVPLLIIVLFIIIAVVFAISA
jgi:hypothetical protein